MGVGNRLVQTPLTDRCYLTLTQALHMRLGGNPFGPAGTGKTESVNNSVHNSDASFLCSTVTIRLIFKLWVESSRIVSVGAWGCFDETIV